MSKNNNVEYLSDDENIDQYNNIDIGSDIEDDIENDIEDDDNNELTTSKKDNNVTELDNDDNENDYIDDENDDIDDETYEPDDENDEDENDNHNYIEDNINFNDNENDNDMKCEIIVKSENRITSNILSIYEYIELISIRASQITNGSFVFTDVAGLSDPLEMAKKEVIDNRCPLYVKRHIGLNRYELWSPNVMSKPKI